MFENVNINFKEGCINHLLGANGTGKSSFCKSLLGVLRYEGEINEVKNPVVVIGSYTSIPSDLNKDEILKISKKKSNNRKNFENLLDLLNIKDIPNNKMKNLSDGQKQKMKLVYFLAEIPRTLILDEFTSSLDKKTINEIYSFFNGYIPRKKITLVNITHSMDDLHNMDGEYYIIEDKKIIRGRNKEEIIDRYVGRGS